METGAGEFLIIWWTAPVPAPLLGTAHNGLASGLCAFGLDSPLRIYRAGTEQPGGRILTSFNNSIFVNEMERADLFFHLVNREIDGAN